jgi:hypothetical protein
MGLGQKFEDFMGASPKVLLVVVPAIVGIISVIYFVITSNASS